MIVAGLKYAIKQELNKGKEISEESAITIFLIFATNWMKLPGREKFERLLHSGQLNQRTLNQLDKILSVEEEKLSTKVEIFRHLWLAMQQDNTILTGADGQLEVKTDDFTITLKVEHNG